MSFLTLEEAGRMTGLGRASIYKELKEGRLKSYKVGPNNGRYKITNEHVEEYLKKCRQYGPLSKHFQAHRPMASVGLLSVQQKLTALGDLAAGQASSSSG